jgi:hypothetical protein
MTTRINQINPVFGETISTRSGWRNYPLEIIEGELYEVWLHHDWEEPKPCVGVVPIATDAISPNWEVLVDGNVQRVHTGQIFRTGTATRPDPPITFPKIKAVASPLFANEIVAVQPMTMPTGNLFYMDYKYGKEK